ncbi:MAG TPA: isocitrate lyase/phosphoenolpyruvate mutase family protein [Micromonosporaceae bacterium]|jgi:2-methylisocitrate lyase-like PEP mutase family enzyme|nr:isocitrate lyase/phosphoenolpyruvate mutase family protein [Micromonosporaceae bacterium]
MTADFDEFRALHRPGKPLLLPNAWDFASAAAFVDAGFPAVGTTSLGVAAAAGLPDAAGLARAETYALARRLGRLDCLVTIDIEAGFSAQPADVARLAHDLAATGAVGVNIEDGRPDGTLATTGTQVELIRAIKQRVPHLFVNARTDTHWLNPSAPDLTDTIQRLLAYRDAGADGVFVPGIAEPTAIRAVVNGVDAPLNVLFLPGRQTVAGLADLGVARISTGSWPFRVALSRAVAAVAAVATGRTDDRSEDVLTYRDVLTLTM